MPREVTARLAPAYAYEKAPDQEHFLGVQQTRSLFSEAFADGRNRHPRQAPLCYDCQSRSEEIFLAELRVTHVKRIRVLDDGVNIFIPAMPEH